MTCLDLCLSVPLSSLSPTCHCALSVLQFLWSKPFFKSMLFLISHLSMSAASSLVCKSSQRSPLTTVIQLCRNLEVIFKCPPKSLLTSNPSSSAILSIYKISFEYSHFYFYNHHPTSCHLDFSPFSLFPNPNLFPTWQSKIFKVETNNAHPFPLK